MNAIVYLMQVNLFLLLFYGFYKLLLRKETFNNLNRAYLVVAGITAFAVPFLQSELVRSWFVTKQVNDAIYTVYSPDILIIAASTDAPMLWIDILRMIYVCVVIFLTAKLVLNLLATHRLFSDFSDDGGEAFSFFGKIKVDSSLENHDTIYRHEEVHSKHLHSADVLLFEVIGIVCWFNPVVYFYKNVVRDIHEFIADDLASRNLNCKTQYATLLLSQQFNVPTKVLTNTFYKPSTIKVRIEMLLKKRSQRTALLKYGLIAPLFLVMMVFASATMLDKNGLEQIAESVEVPLTELPKVENVSILLEKMDVKSKPIEGHVFDVNGYGIQGVTVNVYGSGVKTSTNASGFFRLEEIPDDAVLVFSYEDMASQSVAVAGLTRLTVELKSIENTFKEVIVTAFPLNADKPARGAANTTIFTTVEQQPEFPGGVQEMYKYIARRINYPAAARKANAQGKVFVKFVVEANGEIGSIDVLKGIGFGCDEEAVRVVAQMPKWTPGMQNGQPVRVYFTMPISFKLEQALATPYGFSQRDKTSDNLEMRGAAIRIRGINGIEKLNQPLFVIDGLKVENNALNNVRPADIASINVIKDAEAVRMYGERGKGGVFVITTKNSVAGDYRDNYLPPPPPPPKVVYDRVDQDPEFPGGERDMYSYISRNINYPNAAQRANTQGKVFLKFVVEADGSIENIEVIQGIGHGCDEEAKRVVSTMPKWSPGKVNGVAVPTYFTMPIKFSLE